MKAVNNILSISIIILSLLYFSCNSKKNVTTTRNISSQSNLTNHTLQDFLNHQDSVEIISNSNGNLLLYLSKKTVSSEEPIINIIFLVFDKPNNKVLIKNEFSRSNIKWFDNEQLLLTKKMGVIDKETNKSFKQYLIDVYTNKMKEYNPSKQLNK